MVSSGVQIWLPAVTACLRRGSEEDDVDGPGSSPDGWGSQRSVLAGRLIVLLSAATPDHHKPSQGMKLLFFLPPSSSPALPRLLQLWETDEREGRKRCWESGQVAASIKCKMMKRGWCSSSRDSSPVTAPAAPAVSPRNARRTAGQADSWPGWHEALKTI